MKKDDQYFGTTAILESEPVSIPNAKKCRFNHGLVMAVPSEDITFRVFKVPAYKARLKSLQKRKREIEERNRKETEKRNRESEKAVLENYNKNEQKS